MRNYVDRALSARSQTMTNCWARRFADGLSRAEPKVSARWASIPRARSRRRPHAVPPLRGSCGCVASCADAPGNARPALPAGFAVSLQPQWHPRLKPHCASNFFESKLLWGAAPRARKGARSLQTRIPVLRRFAPARMGDPPRVSRPSPCYPRSRRRAEVHAHLLRKPQPQGEQHDQHESRYLFPHHQQDHCIA